MLYNKRWDKQETKADPFTLESLINWLQQQPADKTYDYRSHCDCMNAQYFKAQGFDVIACGYEYFTFWKEHRWMIFKYYTTPRQRLPEHFDAIAIGESGMHQTQTFGAALDRALSLQG